MSYLSNFSQCWAYIHGLNSSNRLIVRRATKNVFSECLWSTKVPFIYFSFLTTNLYIVTRCISSSELLDTESRVVSLLWEVKMPEFLSYCVWQLDLHSSNCLGLLEFSEGTDAWRQSEAKSAQWKHKCGLIPDVSNNKQTFALQNIKTIMRCNNSFVWAQNVPNRFTGTPKSLANRGANYFVLQKGKKKEEENSIFSVVIAVVLLPIIAVLCTVFINTYSVVPTREVISEEVPIIK